MALTAATEGAGLDAIIRVTFTNNLAMDNAGINVKVFKNPIATVVPARAPGIAGGIARIDGSAVVYSVAKSGFVRLDLFDLQGRNVATMAAGSMTAGSHRAAMPLNWKGAGVLRLITDDESIVQRVIVP